MKGLRMADINFEQMLARYNQDYREAEAFGADWMPPDNDYTIVVTKVKKGVTVKNDQQVGWWKLTGKIDEIANPKLHGKEFPIGFYRTTGMGFLKSAAKALNDGESVNSLTEADKIFSTAEGLVLQVRVTTTTKDDGRVFTNSYIQEVIQVLDVDSATDPAEAQEG